MKEENDAPKTFETLSLQDAKRMLAAGEAKAEQIGIQGSNEGKIVIFGDGFPIRRKGVVMGAIGTSAGTVEQDIQVAEAAAEGIEPSIQPAPVGVS